MTRPAISIRDLFADYRAEWPASHFAKYFVRPAYFSKLESPRPCFLFGGRGTGKTTTLRSLRFDAAQTRISETDPAAPAVDALDYFGIYLRMDKNQVRAFDGPELAPADWARVFAHYFNLLAVREFCAFMEWTRKVRPELSQLSPPVLARLATSLALNVKPGTADDLRCAIDDAVIALELFVINPTSVPRPILSIAERPVREAAEAVAAIEWATDRPIFLCIDEYENLLAYQQSVLNTYVKHSSVPLSYKVGVRGNGLHSHRTIDDNDQLQTPDDYVEIDIVSEGFEMFARSVAEQRLHVAIENGLKVPSRLDDFLEHLTPEQEAALLGVGNVATKVLEAIKGDSDLFEFAQQQQPLRLALVAFWYDGHKEDSLESLVKHWRTHRREWDTRYGNYVYNLLVWLSKGRKGARVRKYYCGSTALILMASGNIRYFMELLDFSIEREMQVGEPQKGVWVLSAKSQTYSAKTVGQKRLDQLEGVSENGVRLKRLVLGLGRTFFERARQPNTAPEQTGFTLTGASSSLESLVSLIEDGVGYLAFEAAARTKRTSKAEPRDNEYRIHPIYSALFEISYRKKRRISFDAADLEFLIENPSAGIAKLLGAPVENEDELPEQLALFAPFFRAEAREFA